LLSSFLYSLLEEYLEKDQGRLCGMFTPKVSPDNNLVQMILKYNLTHRSVLTTGSVNEVGFLASYPENIGLNFSGRVGASENELEACSPYLHHLWAMELDPTPSTKLMIDAVHKLGLRAMLIL
jgi:hypothetical protein